MDKQYSQNPAEREAEAKKYRVFHKDVRIPRKWKNDWDELLQGRNIKEGHPWPDSLLKLMRNRKWPEYTFGTANASCLVVLHRPGKADVNKVKDTYIQPTLPVLGGIPHTHNVFWYGRYSKSQTWGALHRYLPSAFKGLKNPWSQVMTTNLTTTLASTGEINARSNLQAINNGTLDFLVELCQPRIILLCGKPVQNAASLWKPTQATQILPCYHPSARAKQSWGAGEGERVQQAVREVLYASR